MTKERMLKDSTLKVLDVQMPVQEVADEILKTSHYEIKPMTPEDAVMQMEMLGHSFYIFMNSETNKVAVVYLREDHDYGIIETNI